MKITNDIMTKDNDESLRGDVAWNVHDLFRGTVLDSPGVTEKI
jgi:hypothetical protein